VTCQLHETSYENVRWRGHDDRLHAARSSRRR
jgi:hypothetical protein